MSSSGTPQGPRGPKRRRTGPQSGAEPPAPGHVSDPRGPQPSAPSLPYTPALRQLVATAVNNTVANFQQLGKARSAVSKLQLHVAEGSFPNSIKWKPRVSLPASVNTDETKAEVNNIVLTAQKAILEVILRARLKEAALLEQRMSAHAPELERDVSAALSSVHDSLLCQRQTVGHDGKAEEDVAMDAGPATGAGSGAGAGAAAAAAPDPLPGCQHWTADHAMTVKIAMQDYNTSVKTRLYEAGTADYLSRKQQAQRKAKARNAEQAAAVSDATPAVKDLVDRAVAAKLAKLKLGNGGGSGQKKAPPAQTRFNNKKNQPGRKTPRQGAASKRGGKAPASRGRSRADNRSRKGGRQGTQRKPQPQGKSGKAGRR